MSSLSLLVLVCVGLWACSPESAPDVVIKNVEPASVTSRGGVEVTLQGEGFNQSQVLSILGQTLDASVLSSSTITFIAPPLLAGTRTLVLRDAAGALLATHPLEIRPTTMTFTEVGTPYIPLESGTAQNQIACGDYDGDGSLDAAVVSSFSSTYLANQGGGFFTSEASPLLELIPGNVTLVPGDFDGDGASDLFVCRDDGRYTAFFAGGASTPLYSGEETGWYHGCRAPTYADMDGDGVEDLLYFARHVFDKNGYYLTILSGDPTGQALFTPMEGHFQESLSLDNTALYNSDATVTTELSLDSETVRDGEYSGRIDYDFTNKGAFSLVTFTNNGGFSKDPEALSMDIYGDGREMKLVLRVWDANYERYAIDMGPIDWTGWRTVEATGITEWTHYSGDVNGVFDLPVSQVSIQLDNRDATDISGHAGTLFVDNIQLYDTDMRPAFVEDFERVTGRYRVGAAPLRTRLSDMDGDHRPELVHLLAGGTDPLRILHFGDTDDASRFYLNYQGVTLPEGNYVDFCLLDLEGDGDMDIFLVNADGQDILLMNDGTGHFSNITEFALPFDRNQGASCEVADLDRDGFDDLIIGGRQAMVRLYRNDGDGGFLDYTPNLNAIGKQWRSFTIADVDGDGDLDIIAFVYNQGFALFIQDNELVED